MKNTSVFLVSLASLFSVTFLLAFAATAKAGFTESDFPNNTNTRLFSAEQNDSALQVESAHIYQHLYGRDLVLLLSVENRTFEKTVSVQNLQTSQRWNVVYSEMPHREVAAGSYQGIDGHGRDLILVRIKGTHWEMVPYEVRVCMGFFCHEVRNVTIVQD